MSVCTVYWINREKINTNKNKNEKLRGKIVDNSAHRLVEASEEIHNQSNFCHTSTTKFYIELRPLPRLPLPLLLLLFYFSFASFASKCCIRIYIRCEIDPSDRRNEIAMQYKAYIHSYLRLFDLPCQNHNLERETKGLWYIAFVNMRPICLCSWKSTCEFLLDKTFDWERFCMHFSVFVFA